jgi:hypothetical protein
VDCPGQVDNQPEAEQGKGQYHRDEQQPHLSLEALCFGYPLLSGQGTVHGPAHLSTLPLIIQQKDAFVKELRVN